METDALYSPGSACLQLSLNFDVVPLLTLHGYDAMHQLNTLTQETVAITVVMQQEAVCISMIEPRQSLRCSFERPQSAPAQRCHREVSACASACHSQSAYFAEPVRQHVRTPDAY